MKLLREHKLAIGIYLLALAAYAGASSGRLRRHSDDDHYVWLAYGWLHGRLDLGRPPPHSNDWAQVEYLTLTDGRLLRGAFFQGSAQTFRTLKGEIVQVPPTQIARRETKYYVSFPPFPAVLLAPFVAIWGLDTNDVIFTVVLAAAAPALFFLLLRRLRARGDSERSEADDLWLTSVLAVGSVFYFCSVLGQVWYTAHVVSVVLIVLYVHAALDAKHPVWAGLAVGCGFLCRPEILFTAPLFLWEMARVSAIAESDAARALREQAERTHELNLPAKIARWARYGMARFDGASRRRVLRSLVLFALPIAVLGFAAGALNIARFGKLTEFGHTYLNVKWTPRIQKYGLFNYAFLGRNLYCLLALLPRVVRGAPWVQVSWHGLAIWVTTPVVLWVLWPRRKGPLHRPLWLTIACVAIPDLLYQNSGWVQFGYRFQLDYLIFLLCLMAIGGRRFGGWWKVLVVVGVIVNLFGAITFGRMWQFYFDAYFPPGID